MKGNRVFIIGVPRSGNTIVGELLSQHSKIRYFDEVDKHYPTSEYVEFLLKHYTVVNKFPSYCMQFPNLIKQFPDAKFILMIRNREMVIKSAQKHPNSPFMVEGEHRMDVICDKYIEIIKPFISHPNCYPLEFEDLILKKEKIIKNLFWFLDLKLEPIIMEFADKYIDNKQVPNYPLTAKSYQERKVRDDG